MLKYSVMFKKSVLCIIYIASLYRIGMHTGIMCDGSINRKIFNETSSSSQTFTTSSNDHHIYHHSMFPWYHDMWYNPWLEHSTHSWVHADDEDDELDFISAIIFICAIFGLAIFTICAYTSYQDLYTYSPHICISILAIHLITTFICIYVYLNKTSHEKKKSLGMNLLLYILPFTLMSGIFAIFNPIFILYCMCTSPILIEQVFFM